MSIYNDRCFTISDFDIKSNTYKKLQNEECTMKKPCAKLFKK